MIKDNNESVNQIKEKLSYEIKEFNRSVREVLIEFNDSINKSKVDIENITPAPIRSPTKRLAPHKISMRRQIDLSNGLYTKRLVVSNIGRVPFALLYPFKGESIIITLDGTLNFKSSPFSSFTRKLYANISVSGFADVSLVTSVTLLSIVSI